MKKATEFVPPTQEEVGADLRALFLQAVHMTLTVLLEEKVDRLEGDADVGGAVRVGRQPKPLTHKRAVNGRVFLRDVRCKCSPCPALVPN